MRLHSNPKAVNLIQLMTWDFKTHNILHTKFMSTKIMNSKIMTPTQSPK